MLATASYEIFRTDCRGAGVFMEGSAFEMSVEIPIAAEVMDLLQSMMNTRGAAACDTWSTDEYSASTSAAIFAQQARHLNTDGTVTSQ